jgi:hypothetical protein
MESKLKCPKCNCDIHFYLGDLKYDTYRAFTVNEYGERIDETDILPRFDRADEVKNEQWWHCSNSCGNYWEDLNDLFGDIKKTQISSKETIGLNQYLKPNNNIENSDSSLNIIWKGVLEKINNDKTLVLRMPLQFRNGELITTNFRSSTNNEHGSIKVSGIINDNKLELKITYENHHPVLNSKQVIINAKSEDGHFYEGNWTTNTASGVFCVFNPLKAY